MTPKSAALILSRAKSSTVSPCPREWECRAWNRTVATSSTAAAEAAKRYASYEGRSLKPSRRPHSALGRAHRSRAHLLASRSSTPPEYPLITERTLRRWSLGGPSSLALLLFR